MPRLSGDRSSSSSIARHWRRRTGVRRGVGQGSDMYDKEGRRERKGMEEDSGEIGWE